MRLEQFYMFVKIAETHSIRKASAELYQSPQAVSKAMLQLEDELQTKLYDRTNTGVKLTGDGEKAYHYMQKILRDLDDMLEEFHMEKTMISASEYPVKIVTAPILDTYVTYIVKNLYEEFPKAIVSEMQYSRGTINQMFFSGKEIDADIVLGNVSDNKMQDISDKVFENYDCYFLYQDELRIQIPKDSPYAQLDVFPLKELEELPLLIFDLDNGPSELEKIFEKKNIKLRRMSKTANLNTCSQVALQTNRCCFVGYPSVELRPLSNVVYLPLEEEYRSNQLMMISKNAKNTSYVQKFYENMDMLFNLKQIKTGEVQLP